jgi:hypothetical protein
LERLEDRQALKLANKLPDSELSWNEREAYDSLAEVMKLTIKKTEAQELVQSSLANELIACGKLTHTPPIETSDFRTSFEDVGLSRLELLILSNERLRHLKQLFLDMEYWIDGSLLEEAYDAAASWNGTSLPEGDEEVVSRLSAILRAILTRQGVHPFSHREAENWTWDPGSPVEGVVSTGGRVDTVRYLRDMDEKQLKARGRRKNLRGGSSTPANGTR